MRRLFEGLVNGTLRWIASLPLKLTNVVFCERETYKISETRFRLCPNAWISLLNLANPRHVKLDRDVSVTENFNRPREDTGDEQFTHGNGRVLSEIFTVRSTWRVTRELLAWTFSLGAKFKQRPTLESTTSSRNLFSSVSLIGNEYEFKTFET